MKNDPQKETSKMMKLLNCASWYKERNQLRNALQPRKESGI